LPTDPLEAAERPSTLLARWRARSAQTTLRRAVHLRGQAAASSPKDVASFSRTLRPCYLVQRTSRSHRAAREAAATWRVC